MIEKTLSIIKPSSVRLNHTGKIIDMFVSAGFTVSGMKMTKLTRETAGAFYDIHQGKPFFESLLDYMTSGPVVALALEKENAVRDYRELIGATDPAEALPGTVRKLFGLNKTENAVHGSDSPENGLREIGFFFSEAELVANKG